jgi:hypothetical protein
MTATAHGAASGSEPILGRRQAPRTASAFLLAAAPQLARAHGGGLELVVPLWPIFFLVFVWFLLAWRARARAKLTTLAAVTAAWWLGAFAADRPNGSRDPLDVAERFAIGTLLFPASVWVVAWLWSRSRPSAPPER